MKNNEEIRNFKEEFSKRLDEVENRITQIKPVFMDNKLNEIFSKLDFFTARLDEIEKMANKDKVLIDSIHDLKTQVWDSSQLLSTHDKKLNGVAKDLKDSIYKFDKIYLDNLHLPGVVGDSNCRFKNFKEFIEV